MELYNGEVIKALQYAINNKNYEITSYDTYDKTFLGSGNVILSNDIRLEFKIEPNGHRYGIIKLNDVTIGTTYISEWKKTAAGKFLLKDWRKDTKDILGNIIYHTISYTTANGLKMCGIVRDLVEYYDTSLSEEELKEYKQKYANITIDNHYYSVIKLWRDSDRFKTLTLQTFGNFIDDSLRTNIDDMNASLPEDEDSEKYVQDEAVNETLF